MRLKFSRSTKGEHDQMTKANDDPIAIIGMSCRLPQAPDPEAFWKLLCDGTDAITEAPAHRWDAETLSELGIRHGGFLDRVDEFDAAFFDISPREATEMDPQQRLVLELSWEVLENARIIPAKLRGSRTGVFIGAMASDYAGLRDSRRTPIGQHTLTGQARGIIANRVSYALGLTGPSVTVDSAQASALVAVHIASESLRRGESALAIAGGVNLNLATAGTVGAARFGALSP